MSSVTSGPGPRPASLALCGQDPEHSGSALRRYDGERTGVLPLYRTGSDAVAPTPADPGDEFPRRSEPLDPMRYIKPQEW